MVKISDEVLRVIPFLSDDAVADIIRNSEGWKSALAPFTEEPKEQEYPEDPVEFTKKILGYDLWGKQQDVARSVVENRKTVVSSGHAVGKCVNAESKIPLANGTCIRAKSLVGQWFKIIGFDPTNWHMRPMDAYAEDNGTKPIYRITTNSGRTIERTNNHPLLTWNGWKTVDELSVGNKIAIPLELNCQTSQKVDNGIVKLLAYLITEGWLGVIRNGNNSNAYIAQMPGIILDEIRSIVCDMGWNFVACQNSMNLITGHNNDGKTIREFLMDFDMYGCHSENKFVPELIWQLSDQQIALFLNRCYSGDGYVHTSVTSKTDRAMIGFTTVSQSLAQDISLLLLRIGVVSRIKPRKQRSPIRRPTWEVMIENRQDAKNFFEKVGLIFGKESASENVYKIACQPPRKYGDALPFYDYLDKGAGKGLWPRCSAKGKYRFRDDKSPSRKDMLRYEKRTGEIVNNGWVYSKVGFDKIVSIEFLGDLPSVAICVPETNAYVTTVIEHNSHVSSALACWWMATKKPNAIVVTLAPSWSQVQNILWRYMRHMGRSANLPGEILDTPRWNISPIHYAVGLSPKKSSQEDVATMQGFHAENLLVIMDEAAGMPRIMFDAIINLATSTGNRILAIGNPIAQSGPFWDACNSSTWRHIQISCLEHPNVITGEEVIPGAVSREWVMTMIEDHCIQCEPLTPGSFEWGGMWLMPDPIFQARVLGRAPTESDTQLIPASWILTAQSIELPASGERIIGFDPARMGGDDSTMVCRQGSKILWIKRRRPITKDIGSEMAGWLAEEMRASEVTRAYVDEIGHGQSVLDACRRLGIMAIGVNVSRPSYRKRRYVNLRTELWYSIRTALGKSLLQLPNDELLAGDLVAPKFSYDHLGRIELEDKEKIKGRIGRSCDTGDALALSLMSSRPIEEEVEAAEPNAMIETPIIHSRWATGLTRGGAGRWIIGGGSRWPRARRR